MRVRRGVRPWPIRLACLAFLVKASFGLLYGLSDLSNAQGAYEIGYPEFEWNRDRTIVALSAEFTIALIPILWIWFLARPFARWMVTALGLWQAWGLASIAIGQIGHLHFITLDVAIPLGLIVGSIALLFTPSANRYFARDAKSRATKSTSSSRRT